MNIVVVRGEGKGDGGVCMYIYIYTQDMKKGIRVYDNNKLGI